MKNKTIIIFLIFLLILIIIGLILVLVVSLNGNYSSFWNLNGLARKNTQIILDENYQAGEINKIQIIADAANIKIEKGTGETIRVLAYGKEESEIQVSKQENTLQMNGIKSHRNWSFFSFYGNDIILYIPENYDGTIGINNQYGDIQAVDLENASFQIKASCGDIDLQKAKNAEIECNYGDITIQTILNKLEIEADCGNIKIENLRIQEDSNIKCDYGDIEIQNTNPIYMEADVDLGDIKIKENDRTSPITLKVKVDCGDVKIGQ